jgi:hypothetical protein
MATSTLRDICIDAQDPMRLARFWAEVLGYTIPPLEAGDPGESIVIVPPDGINTSRIWFNAVPEPKTVKNRVHIDINMSDDEEPARLFRLGATAREEIRGEDGTLWWTIMADPEGNEFCAFPPRR